MDAYTRQTQCEAPDCMKPSESPVLRFCAECRDIERQLIGADDIERQWDEILSSLPHDPRLPIATDTDTESREG